MSYLQNTHDQINDLADRLQNTRLALTNFNDTLLGGEVTAASKPIGSTSAPTAGEYKPGKLEVNQELLSYCHRLLSEIEDELKRMERI